MTNAAARLEAAGSGASGGRTPATGAPSSSEITDRGPGSRRRGHRRAQQGGLQPSGVVLAPDGAPCWLRRGPQEAGDFDDVTGRPPAALTDDLGRRVQLARPPQRVVSLVPSLTEAIAVSAPTGWSARPTWCTHPADLDVARVRGTKNPDRTDRGLRARPRRRQPGGEPRCRRRPPAWRPAFLSGSPSPTTVGRRPRVARPDACPTPAVFPAARAGSTARPTSGLPAAGLAPASAAVPSGGSRGWWSAREPSPATCSPGSASSTCSPTRQAATRAPRSTRSVASRPTLFSAARRAVRLHAGRRPGVLRGHALRAGLLGRSLTWYGPSLATARAELKRLSPARDKVCR